MFQQMITSSLAVLTRPSVPTFEEHERDNLAWATIYVAIAAAITGLLGAIGSFLHRPFVEEQLRQFNQQMDELAALGTDVTWVRELSTNLIQGSVNPIGSMISSVLVTLAWFYISLFLVFLIGLALGGTGRFGHLTYDMALFSAPLAVVNAVLSLVGVGPIGFLTGLVSLGIWVYSLVLTYFGIRAGMNLTHGKALTIVLLPVILIVLLFACSCAFIVLAIIGAANAG